MVSQDHVAPNNTGQGKHNKSTYVAQGTPPVTLTGEIAAFCQTSGAGNSEIYVQRDGVSTNYQLTGPASSLNGALMRGGTTALLGALQMKWAVVTTASGAGVYTWATECGSAFNSTPIFYFLVGAGTGFSLSSVTATNFTVTSPIGGVPAQVFAIGA